MSKADRYRKILEIARNEIGVREIAGASHNPRVLEYHQATKHKNPTDEAHWCSAAACWVHQQAGESHPSSSIAGDWLEWGVPLSEPVPGCIVLIRRGKNAAGKTLYHVGFWIKEAGDRVEVLGGNQGDEFCQKAFQRKNIVCYRGFA